ncbi:hypothetical protein BU15DRAFT_50472, partial [Melanogaster broomeanus]
NNSPPGRVKAECSNCGVAHTPLWRRGLNDELNCNACGHFCKLICNPLNACWLLTHSPQHKHPRPQAAPPQEMINIMGGSICLFARITQLISWSSDITHPSHPCHN